MVSSRCTSLDGPSVAMESAWVCPRVKRPEPCVRGSSPTSTLIGRIVLVSRPSMRTFSERTSSRLVALVRTSMRPEPMPWRRRISSSRSPCSARVYESRARGTPSAMSAPISSRRRGGRRRGDVRVRDAMYLVANDRAARVDERIEPIHHLAVANAQRGDVDDVAVLRLHGGRLDVEDHELGLLGEARREPDDRIGLWPHQRHLLGGAGG